MEGVGLSHTKVGNTLFVRSVQCADVGPSTYAAQLLVLYELNPFGRNILPFHLKWLLKAT